MPKTKSFEDKSTRTVSTNLVTISEDTILTIQERYAFNPDFDLLKMLDDINSWYQLIKQMPNKSTDKQVANRLTELNNQINTLVNTISKLSSEEKSLLIDVSYDSEVKFLPSEAIEYLNWLARHSYMAVPEDSTALNKGRPKRGEARLALEKMFNSYESATGKKPTCSYDEYQRKYTSQFVNFCEDVIELLNLEISNITIGKFMKELNKTKTPSNKTD